MKKLFKTISLLLLVVIAGSLLGCADIEVKPYAASDESFFVFTAISSEDGGTETVGYSVALNAAAKNLPERLALPETYDGLPVTRVSKEGFRGSSVKELLLPTSISSVENMAFAECVNLEKVYFYSTANAGCVEIASGAFYECGALAELDLPKTLKTIGDSAFYGCYSLTSVEIPRPVTSLGKYCFARCTKLERVEIAVKLETVGEGAFTGCSKDLLIVVSESNPYFYAKDGELVKKEG